VRGKEVQGERCILLNPLSGYRGRIDGGSCRGELHVEKMTGKKIQGTLIGYRGITQGGVLTSCVARAVAGNWEALRNGHGRGSGPDGGLNGG